jgi:two-component system OmpR family response regulator
MPANSFESECLAKVLLVEDNERCPFRAERLERSGTIPSITQITAAMACSSLPANHDVIIMDRMPGGIDGLGIIAAARTAGTMYPF